MPALSGSHQHETRRGPRHLRENGAGKSTLMKVLTVYPYPAASAARSSSTVRARYRTINDSERHGIVIIHQELALVPLLSIAENIFLGHETARRGVIDWGSPPPTRELLARVGLKDRRPHASTTSASASSSWWRLRRRWPKDVRLLILDEPTASLNESDSAALLELLLALKGQGIACVLISHKLNEIARDRRPRHRAARRQHDRDDRLRGARSRQRGPRSSGHGRHELENRFPTGRPIGDEALRIEDWTVHHPASGRVVVDSIEPSRAPR